jgi:hypothetical protein
MKVLRHMMTQEINGVMRSDSSYEVIEATPEEEAELLSQPEGTANDWVEANAEIVDEIGSE